MKKQGALGISLRRSWQARQELNPQPPVLETGALPIELLAYPVQATPDRRKPPNVSPDAAYESGKIDKIS